MSLTPIQQKLAARARACKTTVSAVLSTVSLLLPFLTQAADWEINPVRIVLSQQQQTAAITIKNASDQPTSIQIQVVAWTQNEGQDIYVPSRELLVSPPIVTIPAKGEQVIRAALRRPADTSQELSYRINLQELPPPPAPDFKGVQVAMRVGLPVFVEPLNEKAAAQMEWNLKRSPDNQLKLTLQNKGNAHVQVTDFSLYLPGGNTVIASEAGSSYIMAGQSHTWLLKPASPDMISGDLLQLKAFTDAGDIDTSLALGKP